MRVRCRNGSPAGCKVKALSTPGYSAGAVVRVWNGLPVSKKTDENSCPEGYKIWSPRNKNDWEIVWRALGKNVANYPNKNHVIVDVTKPRDNACVECAGPMKSGNPKQNEWRTSDGSAWWLRDTPYNYKMSSYKTDCYIGLQKLNPDDVQFGSAQCTITSKDYLCQPIAKCKYTL